MSTRARFMIFGWAVVIFGVTALVDWHENPHVRRAAGIVLATLLLWITEIAPLGVVAMLVPIAATWCGLLTWNEAVGSWGDPIIFLFLGAFLLARALDKHGAFQWLAHARWAKSRDGRAAPLTLSIMGISGALSSMQNNTAVTAMLLPVVTRLAATTAVPAIVLLSLSYGATFGGMTTPVGTAPNFIGYSAMKRIDPTVSFLSWMRVGAPVWIGTTAIAWLVLRTFERWRRRRPAALALLPGPKWLEDYVVTDVGPPRTAAPADPHGAARRWALGAFAAAATVWLSSGVVLGVTSPENAANQWVRAFLPESLVPVLLAWLLFMARVGPKRQTVLDRHDFQSLDWDTLFLIAGGLVLGRMLERSGAATELARAVAESRLGPTTILFALAGVTVLLSELTSNTATASLMVPIAGSVAPAAGLSEAQGIWLVALSASLGFALPVSTPPNALVYGTRLVPLRLMAGLGVIVDILSVTWVACCVRWFA